MSCFDIDINPCNPGHFYTCGGFLELADRMWSGCLGEFRSGGRVFRVTVPGNEPDPFNTILKTVADTDPLVGLAPDADDYIVKENAEGKERGDTRYQAAPLVFLPKTLKIRLDWWTNLKWWKPTDNKRCLSLWSGQQTLWAPRKEKTIPSLQRELRKIMVEPLGPSVLNITRPISSRVGVDPTSSVTALHVGFSPNEHHIDVHSSPVTELFGLVGFQGFRPARTREGGVSIFTYTLWDQALPVPIARAAAGGAFPGKRFSFGLTERGEYKSFGFATPV